MLVLLSNVAMAQTEEQTNFNELSFVEYHDNMLKLDIVDNYNVSLEFEFYIENDELIYYETATYYYNMIDDVLIVYASDGQLIYSDLDL
jgi:hypothetical protein